MAPTNFNQTKASHKQPAVNRELRPFSPLYTDHYWLGGAAEKEAVYLHANQLPTRFAQTTQEFIVAELGFGTALTYALTAHLWQATAPAGMHLHYLSAEAHPLTTADLTTIHASLPPHLQPHAVQALTLWPLKEGWNTLTTTNHTLHLWHGQASHMFSTPPPTLPHNWQAHAWFLDGFNPATNPAMWSLPLMQQVAAHTAPHGTFSTYTAAGHIRRTLTTAGFTVQKIKGHGPKRHMTIGFKQA